MSDLDVKPNVTFQLPTDLNELNLMYIQSGGNPNLKPFQAGLSRAQQLGANQYLQRQTEVEKERGEWAKKAKTWIGQGLDAIVVTFVFIILLAGIVFGLGVLVAAEIAAVSKGFTVIDAAFSGLYAIATVVFFVVILFIREIIAHNTTEEPSPVFSLRHFTEWLLYFVGISKHWQTRYKSTSLLSRVDNAISWLTWTIVLFGLLGRLVDTINDFNGTWLEGLRHIAEQSSLSEMVGIIGAGVMTIALLRGTHFIIFFIHKNFLRVTGGLDMNRNFSSSLSRDYYVEIETVRFYQNEIMRLQARSQNYLTAVNDETQPAG